MKTVKKFAIYRVQEVLTFQIIGRETVNSEGDMANLEGQKMLYRNAVQTSIGWPYM